MHPVRHPVVHIIDNYEDTRLMLRCWLEGLGCHVLEAATGREALELAGGAGEHPGMVRMSLRMPVIDGLAATRRIREHGKECDFPIVAMSTFPTTNELAFAAATGFNAFTSQPFDFDSLSELLGRLVPGSNVDPVPGASMPGLIPLV